MSYKKYYREHLSEALDAFGDIVPPWAKYPDYERYTIGWRMGTGESWLCFFAVFLETLPRDRETRLAYLKRHPIAPISWARSVANVLFPDGGEGNATVELSEDLLNALKELELIKSDVAYQNWCALGATTHLFERPPLEAARYLTREFAFWSRFRQQTKTELELGEQWALFKKDKAINLDEGLITLAKFFFAGRVTKPWELGCTPSDFSDSFDDDMHYVDAYRLYIMSAFDDNEHIERELGEVPKHWRAFVNAELMLT